MKKILAIIAIASLAFSVPSCKSKPKDEDIRTAAQTALSANPSLAGLTVDVKDGIATVSGEVSDETTRAAVDAQLKDVKGLKQVVNNATVTVPVIVPPSGTPEVTVDDALTTAVRDAIKDHPTVKADVKDGVITLTGEIKRSDLPTLMQKLNATKPKKIESAGLVRK